MNRIVSCMVSFMLVLPQNGFAASVLAPAGVKGTLLEKEVAKKPYADSPYADEIENLIDMLGADDAFTRAEAAKAVIRDFSLRKDQYVCFIAPLIARLRWELYEEAQMACVDALQNIGEYQGLDTSQRCRALSGIFERGSSGGYFVENEDKRNKAGMALVAIGVEHGNIEALFAALACDNEDVLQTAAHNLFAIKGYLPKNALPQTISSRSAEEYNEMAKICTAVLTYGSLTYKKEAFKIIDSYKSKMVLYANFVNALIGNLQYAEVAEQAKSLLLLVDQNTIGVIINAIKYDPLGVINAELADILSQLNKNIPDNQRGLKQEVLYVALIYGNSDVRKNAIEQIGKMTDKKTLAYLKIGERIIWTLKFDDDIEVQKAAAVVLGKIDTDNSTHALIKAKEKKGLSETVVRALGKHRIREDLVNITLTGIVLSRRYKKNVRIAAIETLQQRYKEMRNLKKSTCMALIKAAGSYDSDIVYAAVEALGDVEINELSRDQEFESQRYHTLMNILKDDKFYALKYRTGEKTRKDIRVAAAISLGKAVARYNAKTFVDEFVEAGSGKPAFPERDISDLAKLLKSITVPEIQAGIIEALAIAGDPDDYEKTVNEFLKKENKVDVCVRVAAIHALGMNLGRSVKTRELLFEIYEHPENFSKKNYEIKKISYDAQSALGEIEERFVKKQELYKAAAIISRLSGGKITLCGALKSL